MQAITGTPLFGIALSLLAFEMGRWLHKKTGLAVVNPLLVGILLVIAALRLFGIPLADYQQGGRVISLFLSPATASLALLIHRNWSALKENWLPIAAGTVVGSAVSLGGIFLLCRLFGLSDTLTMTFLPKAITTPIAMEMSAAYGGIPSITVALVVVTGILGNICSPFLIRLFRVNNPLAEGVAIGTASHAVGTSKAIEIGECQGAMSGLSIGLAGFFTVLLAAVLFG